MDLCLSVFAGTNMGQHILDNDSIRKPRKSKSESKSKKGVEYYVKTFCRYLFITI